jgi:hypothetical protein
VPAGLDGFHLPPSQRQMKKNLCDLCVSSEAGGEKVIEITRLNPTAQVKFYQT